MYMNVVYILLCGSTSPCGHKDIEPLEFFLQRITSASAQKQPTDVHVSLLRLCETWERLRIGGVWGRGG